MGRDRGLQLSSQHETRHHPSAYIDPVSLKADGSDTEINRPPDVSSDDEDLRPEPDKANHGILLDSFSSPDSDDIVKTTFDKGTSQDKHNFIYGKSWCDTSTRAPLYSKKKKDDNDTFLRGAKRKQTQMGYGKKARHTTRNLSPLAHSPNSPPKRIKRLENNCTKERTVPRLFFPTSPEEKSWDSDSSPRNHQHSSSERSRTLRRDRCFKSGKLRQRSKRREATDCLTKAKERSKLIVPEEVGDPSEKASISFLPISKDASSLISNRPIYLKATGKFEEPDQEIRSICPICGNNVDKVLLVNWRQQYRLSQSIKMQTNFCLEHRTITAREAWKEKGIPDIDWQGLEERIQKYDQTVKGILNGHVKCHFSEEYKETVRRGGKRTLLKTEDSLTPGYYGPRALTLISRSISKRFRSNLRDAAISNKYVSARGNIMFIQSVIVPEIVTRLVMEDMSVDIAKAREILKDTRELGDLVSIEAEENEVGCEDMAA